MLKKEGEEGVRRRGMVGREMGRRKEEKLPILANSRLILCESYHHTKDRKLLDLAH